MGNKSKRRARERRKKLTEKGSCVQCDEPDDGWMVLCDWCEEWYHFGCVNLTEPPTTALWKCPKCEEKERKFESSVIPPQEQPQVDSQGVVKKDPNRRIRRLEDEPTPIYPEGVNVPNSTSVQYSSCSASSNRKLQIELQPMEEDEVLQQKMQQEKYQIEQKYLDLKYDILLKGSERGLDDISLKRTATEDWVKRLTSSSVKSKVVRGHQDEIDMDDFVQRLDALKMTPPQQQRLTNEAPGDVPKITTNESEPQQSHQLQFGKCMDEKYNRNQFEILDLVKLGVKPIEPFPVHPSNPTFPVRKGNEQPSNAVAFDNWNVPLAEGHVLTRDQIASRPVITKDLPIFTGKSEDWPIFHKQYVNSTLLCGYSNGENLYRLQKCLAGKAETAVRNLLLDAESVPDIIDLLELLFGRPELNLSGSHLSFNSKVILRIIPIKIHGNGVTLDTFAFLDDGSTATLMDEKLADDLKLVGVQKNLCLIWSANIHRREKNSRQFSVSISSIDNPKIQFKLREVKTVGFLGIPSQQLQKEELCAKFPHLKNVPFASYENGVPGILIGCNNPRIGIPREVVDGGDFEPIAAKTLIGWTVHGPICDLDSDVKSVMNHYRVEECKCQHEHDESLHQSMKDYFSIDNFGVQVPAKFCTVSKDDEKALQQMQDLTKRVNGRFESGLLWRYESFVLPKSYGMAKRRLECLEKKRHETIKIIDDTIADYVRKGYPRKLSKEEAANHDQRHWYLPIFTVTYPKKPDKHRMVFDAAAKIKGVSLNTMLWKGPDQLVSLVEILRRFREKLYALGGDIREMFHQIEVRKPDQQCQRFLWRNGDQSKEPDVYVMQVLTFGAACSPSVAHFVKNTNAKEYSNDFPKAAESIEKNHYMDDMMDGENSEEELIQLAKDVLRVHSYAGFEIRNFLSNSKKVMDALGSTAKIESKVINPDKEFDIERVLGMWWNVNKDTFTFSLKYLSVTQKILTGESLPTKRELLKLLMSIFDPLGLISHYLIQLKIIIQDVWRSKLEWDQSISSPELVKAWKKWLEVLPTVETIQIPRLLTPKLSKTGTSIELHTFVDASENAFGAVTYLRVEDETGVDCSLIGSKSRVAPLKYLSTTRKELQGGLLGSRLAKSIGESQTFKVNRRVFWSDSSTVLSWLGSDQRKYHQFVAHRVGEILENTNLSEWRWIPTKLNVADDLTKWPKYAISDNSSRWFNAPSFLSESECNWPVRVEKITETMEEMRVMYAHNELIISPFFDSTRFSDWTRMVRAVAYAIRFTKILKAKVRKELVSLSHLSRDELVHAQNVIYRQAQFEGFPDEMVTLELNKELDENHRREIPKSSTLISCSPYLDRSGVLRCRGRIDFAKNISTSTKRPVILPRKNWITKLLIGCYHRIYHHRNHETVVNEVRQRFYIPKLRVALKSIVTNDCQKCKNRRAKPQPPEEGNLPAGRIAIGFRPFTHTGIDYFGPFSITQGRSTVKRWGVIFTCLTVRAVHIEIAYSMTTQSCIKCIRNFIAIRKTERILFGLWHKSGWNRKRNSTRFEGRFEEC